MIITFSDLVSMCKIKKEFFLSKRPERLIYIHVKE